MNPSQAYSKTWTTCFSAGELTNIQVQVLVKPGISKFEIIGLPENVIREGRDRIRAILYRLGVELGTKNILVNLTPANAPKEGSHFDLPIIRAILEAFGVVPNIEMDAFYWGELGLDGSIRNVKDIYAHLLFASGEGKRKLVANIERDAQTILQPFTTAEVIRVESVHDLLSICPFRLEQAEHEEDGDQSEIHKAEKFSSSSASPSQPESTHSKIVSKWVDSAPQDAVWNQLKGIEEQFVLFSVLALGRHHVLVEGPPGVGKSTWCFAVKELMPPLNPSELLQRLRFQNVQNSGDRSQTIDFERPFESPHHSATRNAIVGGGSGGIVCGALTRAHMGILFMDEFLEFSRDILEALREPLETKSVRISRKGHMRTLPADIQLLAAMNLCRCGYQGTKRLCVCTTTQYQKYRSKLSGPILDRFHLRTQWQYFDNSIPSKCVLKEVRSRLIAVRKLTTHIQPEVKIPHFPNPRKLKKWMEMLHSWSKWEGITQISQHTIGKFSNFYTQFNENMEIA